MKELEPINKNLEISLFNNDLENRLKDLNSIEKSHLILAAGLAYAKKNNLTPIATTSGGEYSAVLMNIISELDIPVIFIDMGTACYREETRTQMIKVFEDMGVKVIRRFSKLFGKNTPPTKADLDSLYGESWRNPTSDKYLEVMKELKSVPCTAAIQEVVAESGSNGVLLIRGTREDANIEGREKIEILSPYKFGATLHPISSWSKDESLSYLQENNLPINKHHIDPSRARLDAANIPLIRYPDGWDYIAGHTICSLDEASEKK